MFGGVGVHNDLRRNPDHRRCSFGAKLGIPGEDLPKVAYALNDAQLYKGKDILVVGSSGRKQRMFPARAEPWTRNRNALLTMKGVRIIQPHHWRSGFRRTAVKAGGILSTTGDKTS